LESISHLKVLGLALGNYSSAHDDHLPDQNNEPNSLSWRVAVLPFVGHPEMEAQFDRLSAWNAKSNQPLAQTWISVFDATLGEHQQPLPNGFAISDYGMISGPGTVHPNDHAVTLDEISSGDGLGQTLLLGECVGLRLAWAEPRDPRVDREIIGIETLTKPGQTSNKLLSTYTRGKVPVAFADGGGRFLNAKIDPKILKALCTVDGDEGINQSDYLE